MTEDRQPAIEPTAWGQLIRDAREAIPMSIPEAARRGSISAGQWGNIERGYQTTSRGQADPAPGNDKNVAHMAFVVGVTAEQLEQAGRTKAARILRTITKNQPQREPAEEDRRFGDPELQQIWEDKRLSREERLGTIALIQGMRASQAGQRPA